MRLPQSSRFAGLLMAGAFLGKLLGFVREVSMAHALGASMMADGYRGAITAVMLPIIFVQNECVPAVLVPQHQRWQQEGRAAKALAALGMALFLLATAITVAVEIGLKPWVDVIVGGFSPAGQSLTEDFVAIMALAMPASVLLNVLASAEIAMGRARLTSIRASLLNVSVLVGIGVYVVTGYAHALAWAFTLSFNSLVLWGLWTLWREGLIDPAGLGLRSVATEMADFARRLRPLLVQPVSEQTFWWSERLLASRLVTGSVASMDYARTLTETVILVISQPLGMSVLARGPAKDVPGLLNRLGRPMLALSVPAAVFAIFFADWVVRLVFARGAFDEKAVHLTGSAVAGISTGLWAATLGWVLIRVLNSTGRNGHAALVLTAAFLGNILWNVATASWQPTMNGTLLLGMGEGVRGLVLLFGAAAALGQAWPLLRLVMIASPGAILMALLAVGIRSIDMAGQIQLVLGLLACLVSIAASGAMLLRGEALAVVSGLVRGVLLKAGFKSA